MSAKAPKRILIDARMLGYSGIGRYLSELLPLLANNQQIVFSALVHPFQAASLPENVKPVETKIKPYSTQEQVELTRLIDQQQADLVHFTHINQPVFGLKTRSISTIHDLTMLDFPVKQKTSIKSSLKSLLLKSTFPNILSRNEALLTPTKYVADQLINRFAIPRFKVHTTLLGAPGKDLTKVKTYKLAKKPFFLYVGNALPHKNVRVIIEAADKLPSYQFLLCGHDPDGYEPLKRLASKNVWFADFVEDRELAWLYENAEALIQPSLSEGFGLTGLEAMSYECPIISSNATCLPEVYGSAALFFEPTNSAELISTITSLGRSRSKLIHDGKKQLKLFSWEKCAQQTLAVYVDTLSR